MNAVEQLSAVLPELSSLVDRLWHGQLEQPMPTGGTVHQTIDRMMVKGSMYASRFRGDAAPEITPPFVYGWVPAAEFREVMDDLIEAASQPSAQDRMVSTPLGSTSGGELARLIVIGALLSGRDLSCATGHSFDVPAEVLATLNPFAID